MVESWSKTSPAGDNSHGRSLLCCWISCVPIWESSMFVNWMSWSGYHYKVAKYWLVSLGISNWSPKWLPEYREAKCQFNSDGKPDRGKFSGFFPTCPGRPWRRSRGGRWYRCRNTQTWWIFKITRTRWRSLRIYDPPYPSGAGWKYGYKYRNKWIPTPYPRGFHRQGWDISYQLWQQSLPL